MSKSLKKLHIYFKTKVVNGILGEFFYVYDIEVHESNLRPYKYLKFFYEI
jgi:hypothetical protein